MTALSIQQQRDTMSKTQEKTEIKTDNTTSVNTTYLSKFIPLKSKEIEKSPLFNTLEVNSDSNELMKPSLFGGAPHLNPSQII